MASPGRALSPVAPASPSANVGDEAQIIPGVAADGSLYPIGKMEAHRAGVLHLAVSVFVMSQGAILLQRRAAGKYHCAGLWANTCCSHPQWGEAPAAAARRRLREEMGLSLDLRQTAEIDYAADVSNGLRECEHVHVFLAEADHRSLRIAPDPREVSQTRWVSVAAAAREVTLSPERFAPWFRIYLARWSELGLTSA